MALAEQLAAHRARQDQLRQELLELESAEEAAAQEYALQQSRASAKRLAFSRQFDDLPKFSQPDRSTPS